MHSLHKPTMRDVSFTNLIMIIGLEIIEITKQSHLILKDFSDSSLVGRNHRLNAGIIHSVEIRYSNRKKDPVEPNTIEQWEVGYIANLLGENIDTTYGDREIRKSFSFSDPMLDKGPPGGTSAWYSNTPDRLAGKFEN